MEKKRNTERRHVPGVYKDVKVTRDGEVFVNDREVHNLPIITALDGTRMTIQMAIHKAFPDIPMRRVPRW